ncbi:hypothetical protein G9A89_005409 [Geosiphon pyriformis]|nr:hypothetical protein G9A89_005409 [Geosiphon pyriformis]
MSIKQRAYRVLPASHKIIFINKFIVITSVTKGDSYPTPKIQELFDTFGGKKWFSTLNLDSGYWQVVMKPETKRKWLLQLEKETLNLK